jgi:hypothetical protein
LWAMFLVNISPWISDVSCFWPPGTLQTNTNLI